MTELAALLDITPHSIRWRPTHRRSGVRTCWGTWCAAAVNDGGREADPQHRDRVGHTFSADAVNAAAGMELGEGVGAGLGRHRPEPGATARGQPAWPQLDQTTAAPVARWSRED